jgi:hypothetical protein
MDRGLLVADQDLPHGRLIELMKERENRSTRIVENGVDPLPLQTFNNDLAACFLHVRTP